MPRPTETWEGCRWTRTDPPVNVESSEPTDHQLLFRKKWTVVGKCHPFELPPCANGVCRVHMEKQKGQIVALLKKESCSDTLW